MGSTTRGIVIWVATVMVAASAPATSAPIKSDFVFIVDATGSMGDNIAAVRTGLSAFVAGLGAADIDPRFSIVLFGGSPELVLDWTSDGAACETAMGLITIGARAGFQHNHNLNPEAGLEAVRIVLGEAVDNTLVRDHVGGSGSLVFRADARKNLILVTDEDSDRPFYTANREPGQTSLEPPAAIAGTDWQVEVNKTATAAIGDKAFVNMLVNPGDSPVRSQYGDPAQDASDPDLLNFDPAQTLANLIAAGYGNSLQAQLLSAGLIGRTFDIGLVNTPNFVNNFFAAKIEETIINPPGPLAIPEPSTLALVALGILLLRRRRVR